MLKTEIRRLYDDRRDIRQARMTDEKSACVLERKYILCREMVEKTKSEKYDLQKQNFELKTRMDEMEKRYFEAKLQLKKYTQITVKNISEIASRISDPKRKTQVSAWNDSSNTEFHDNNNVTCQKPLWTSLQSTPIGIIDPSIKNTTPESNRSIDLSVNSQNSSNNKLNVILPDFQSMRLKIESLSSERQFFCNESELLKHNIEQLTKTIAVQERQMASKELRTRKSENELKQHQQMVSTLTKRLNRAEKIAAMIERQFKDAKPNTKIDYSPLINIEPSTQLLAALLPRDTPSPTQIESQVSTIKTNPKIENKKILDCSPKFKSKVN
ncbi:hypothetical protein HK096_006980 [Nowakowskiella sp. JEL0078]|nr:hypothetical protein HK096_006980 [Nowakowskiella sp. JEL0078]